MRLKAICLAITLVVLCPNAHAQWVQTSGPCGGTTWALTLKGTDLFAGLYSGGVYRSTNGGTDWAQANTGLVSNGVRALAVRGSLLFAGTIGYGVFRSTNDGGEWMQMTTGMGSKTVMALTVVGANIFAGTSSGVFLSSNNGTSWVEVDTGFVAKNVRSLTVVGADLFAGTTTAGVWRRPLSQMVTCAEAPPAPGEYALLQNYPNPFNPKTVVSCQSPVASKIRLVVYDLLGREVKVLMDEKKEAGRYAVTWDASGCGSGVYICRMTAGDYVQSRTMVFLK
jgi:hypothetical protein